jgi:uncharacterized membrane protein YdbT with pleckstrin-like domain
VLFVHLAIFYQMHDLVKNLLYDVLMPNEKILFSARIHPAIFLPSALSFVAMVGFGIYTFSLSSTPSSTILSTSSLFSTMMFCFSGFFLLYTLLLGLQALIIMFTTEFAITNRRVIAKTGFIHRHTLEMLLSKIESVAVHQNILGRVLNFGTVTITGTGGTKESFRAIIEPLTVRRKIHEIIEYYTRAYAQQQKTNAGNGS